jgi:ketosteroid isomerase-like protein
VRSLVTPLRERASRRRTLDERLRVRFPGPFQLIGRALFRIPPRSRLRRRTAPYVMARAYAAGNRRDFDLIRTFNDLSVYEYRASADLLPPDLEQVSSRHKGYLQMWQRWMEAFEDIRFEPEEMLDLGDKILVTVEQKGHGSGSGVAVSQTVFQLFTFRRGLVIRQEDFLDRSQALAAAGL